jgi:hypothetical protein
MIHLDKSDNLTVTLRRIELRPRLTQYQMMSVCSMTVLAIIKFYFIRKFYPARSQALNGRPHLQLF